MSKITKYNRVPLGLDPSVARLLGHDPTPRPTCPVNRKQSVVVDGKQSSLIDVVSGVPQGTVLGSFLFLLHINDLPSVVSSKVRLFADVCLIYRNIKNKEDQIALQKDLNLLENWGNTWGMCFNATKCNI